MRKITKEEAAGLVIRKGSSSVVRTAVMNLKPGEILLVEKKDWNQKNGPGQMLTRLRKSTGVDCKVSVLANGGGWIIERVK
jgi:hypothetical protein